MDACFIAEGEWEDKAPSSIRDAKRQIAKCILYFLKDIDEEFAYFSWTDGGKNKFDNGANFFFKILKDIIRIENKVSEIEHEIEDISDDITENLDLDGVKTLRDYLEMKE